MASTLRRSLLRENKTEGGSIQDEMKAYSLKPVENDGINVYGNVRINPITSGPYSDSQEITVSLCSPNFDVTEFSNSYIHLKMKIRMRYQNAPVITDTTSDFGKALAENQYFFIGLKCGTHVLRNYSFKFNDVPITSSMQSSAVYESFLYSTFMSKSERANKKYVFSPYEEVSVLDNSACGVYVPLSAIRNSDYQDLDIIIPYRCILAMSGWNEYPNRLFGDLKIVFNTTSEAFVFTEVSPLASLRKAIISGKIAKTVPHLSEILALADETFDYVHAFEQVGVSSPVQYISGWDATNNKLTFTTCTGFTPYIDEIVTQECWVDCKGYRMSEIAVRALQEHFSAQPFTVCAQKIEVFQFPAAAEPAGLRTSMNIRFNHTTDACLLFPKDSRHRTIFTNICYDNLQLQVGNQRFPEQLISTISPQFHEQQIQASDFDSIFEANEEYEHSLTDVPTDGKVALRPTTDATSFVVLHQFERSGGGAGDSSMWFDGINRPTEKVELTGRPLYPNCDVYYKGVNMPTPLICLDTETYWIFRLMPTGDGRYRPNCQYVVANEYKDGYNNPAVESV